VGSIAVSAKRGGHPGFSDGLTEKETGGGLKDQKGNPSGGKGVYGGKSG